MQYSLTSGAGVVVREATRAPVTCLHGSGVLLPKLEAALERRAVRDIAIVRLRPEGACGERDPDLLCQVPLEDFLPGETIEVGGNVVGRNADDVEVNLTVTEIRDAIAHLDGNHSLTGQLPVFEIGIQVVRNASAQEIAAGNRSDSLSAGK